MTQSPPFDYEKSAKAAGQMCDALTEAGAQVAGCAVPWFTTESWAKLLAVAADRWNLPDTFEQFERDATRRFDEISSRGVPCERVLIDVDRLVEWCRAHGCAIDGRARAAFAAFVLAKRDSNAGTA